MKIKVILLSVVVLISLTIVGIPVELWAGGLSKQAVEYRVKGYQAQINDDIDGAITYYQKAIILNANYATAHNDLGVVYERKGWLDKAEQAYFKALEIDPEYIDAYSNLALLYERKKDIDKALFYWQKRIQLGDLNELWTQKARQKIYEYFPARKYYDRAMSLFEKGNYDKALKEIDRALKLVPRDKEIIDLKKKIKLKFNEEKITARYSQGMKHYRSGNYPDAGEEFKKMLEFLPEKNSSIPE